MIRVAGANVLGKSIRATPGRFEVLALASQLIKERVADPELSQFIGFNSAIELTRHILNAAAVVSLVITTRREGNAGPLPVRRGGTVREFVVQHFADGSNGVFVSGIRVPRREGVNEGPVDHCRIVLPIGTLKRVVIKHGVDQIDLQPRFVTHIVGHLVLNEVPPQPHDLVVTQVLVRLVPRQQSALRVKHPPVPG